MTDNELLELAGTETSSVKSVVAAAATIGKRLAQSYLDGSMAGVPAMPAEVVHETTPEKTDNGGFAP